MAAGVGVAVGVAAVLDFAVAEEEQSFVFAVA